jgi:hypothetical protein
MSGAYFWDRTVDHGEFACGLHYGGSAMAYAPEHGSAYAQTLEHWRIAPVSLFRNVLWRVRVRVAKRTLAVARPDDGAAV